MVRQGTSGKNSSKPKGTPGRQAGRPPLKAVYRRRRLFVAVVLLLVASVALGGFAAVSAAMRSSEQASATDSAGRDGSDGAAAKPEATPSASATPSTPATPTCDQGLVTVSASTDKAAYAAGENPLLSLKVTNGGKVACEVNLGTSQMEYTVTSGSDRIFSSVDCQAESSDLVKTIAPGQSETANFPWERNRSVPGCGAVSAKPGAGGAYYMFVARLGTKSSTKAVFQLL